MLKLLIAYIRFSKVTIAGYIDDFFTTAKSYLGCKRNEKLFIQILDSLGFVVKLSKLIFTPTKIIEYLGFIVNLHGMTVSLTHKKKDSVRFGYLDVWIY